MSQAAGQRSDYGSPDYNGDDGRGLSSLSWESKLVVIFGGALISLAFAAIIPDLPQIDRALSRNPNDSLYVKQFVGIIGLSVAVGAPIAGFLIDRIGIRTIVIVSCACYALAGTAGLYLSDLGLLLGSRLLLGATAAAIDTTSIAIINTRLEGNARARWMGIHMAVMLISGLICQPVSGYLATFSWRAPFVLYALGLPLAFVGAFGLPRTRAEVASITRVRLSGAGKWFIGRYALLSLIIGITIYLPTIYSPFLIREHGVTSTVSISFILMGGSLVSAVSSILYGMAKKYMSVEATFILSLTLVGIGMFITSTADGIYLVVAGILIAGIGNGWNSPNLMTAVGERISKEHQGQAAGIVRTLHELAAPLSVLLVEPFAKSYGPASAILASSYLALGLVFIFAYAIMVRRVREGQRRSAHCCIDT